MAEPTLYLFDGWNLLHAGSFDGPTELIDRLASFVGSTGARGILVFDGTGKTERIGPLEIRFAEEEVRQSKRLYEFTGLIDSSYTAEQKKALVQQLWHVVFADAQLVASEEYVVRKIADLLNVPLADFLDAKIRARDSFR